MISYIRHMPAATARILPAAFRALLAVLFCLGLVPGMTRAAELKTVVAALEQGYQTLADVQASFSQRSVIAGIDREQKGAGNFAIRKAAGTPAMFRFTYTKPQKQEIICNGKTVWLYIPENKQVMQMDTETLFAGGNGIAISYLTGLGEVSRDFTIAFAKEKQDKKGDYLLELIPKKPSAVLAKLLLTISGTAVEQFQETGRPTEPFPVVGSTVIDAGGNRTTMEFSGAKTNKGISPSRFTFKIPAGVEVIKQ
jgi:outer membrane lipoprotein carrier protein